MKSRYALMVSVLLAILATVGLKKILDEQKKRVDEGHQPVEILVAARDLGEGTILKSKDFTISTMPRKYFRPQMAVPRDEDALVGKRLRCGISKELFLRTIDVEVPEAIKEAPRIATGRRLFTLQVDLFSGVGGHLRAGSYVDVLSILREPEGAAAKGAPKGGSGRGERVLTILERVKVFAVGPVDYTKGGYARAGVLSTAVTVDVSPQEAELLAFAVSQGRLILLERSVIDPETGALPREGVTGANLDARIDAARGRKD